ncbi:MAG: 3-deoxy-7-phosphoheptulonate synthase class II [Alphaproteobacteria bacterium]|jgi:3-deoxy-7-phosphoheptulonate synthase|nr:3-deoxy-7-phosphoheptulonate synthase class II [Alphaproteobacteria bacterium]
MNSKWSADSWRNFPVKHQPTYSDMNALKLTEEKLKSLPPLVFAGEARTLKEKLASVSEGNAFLLQGGDCAESFAEFNADNLRDTFRVILQMAAVLTYGASLPIVKVGRLAGQFAKPRSEPTESRDGITLPSYLGDIINGIDFIDKDRKPDPERMIKAYSQAASALNLLRAFATGGYADLHEVHRWNLEFLEGSSQDSKYRLIADRIGECLDFMKACGINKNTAGLISKVDFFTSHEALLLGYEQSLTRVDSLTGDYYDCSSHMLWIGERTRSLDEAHVEFMRGIGNPIGVKIGPTTSPEDIIKLINKLNPNNEAGKLTLISRMGKEKIGDILPGLVRKVDQEGMKVVWSCDPMHGNTFKAQTGYKTRAFDNIMNEVEQFFQIHRSEGTYAGGIHLEMTGQDVTECVGGLQEIKEENLGDRYHTHCDPRLNANQGLELAFRLSEELSKYRK